MGLFAAGLSAGAQQIDVENRGMAVSDGKLHVDVKISAEHLDLGCDGLLRLEFAVNGAEHRLILPPVVYSGKQRYRYENRNHALSGEYAIPPYRVYKGVNKKETYVLDYQLSLPYQAWMKDASVTCRKYLYGCRGSQLISEELMESNLTPEPEKWQPDPALYPSLVCFLNPNVEQVKNRAAMIALNIDYPVGVSEIRPAFGRNASELQKVDTLMNSLYDNELITVNSINVTGYASPDGRYVSNESLAKRRSEGFKKYLIGKYASKSQNVKAYWVAEDWDGLRGLVEASDMEYRSDVLAVIDDQSIVPDSKERIIKQIGKGVPYKMLLAEMFPSLRRIELRADYVISNLSDSKAREMLYTQPGMLSLNEIYRVAQFYEPGSKQYREVYETAARLFPKEVIANNNAAAAILLDGNAEDALVYLEKLGGDSVGYINFGVYHYISGDLEKATEYFIKAQEAGFPQAALNRRMINNR